MPRANSLREVLWHITMSVDGFIAGPGETMDWVFDYWAGDSETAADVIANTGAILIGPARTKSRMAIAQASTAGPGAALLRPDAQPANGRTRLDDGHFHR